MSTVTKRKAAKPPVSTPASKKPRQTLDNFFSPRVPLPRQNLGNDSTAGPSKTADPSHAALNVDQTRVLKMVVEQGKSVFFTGAAGTGKSLLLRAIINGLRKKYGKDTEAVSITASTGMAASNIGGMTIHSWGAVSPVAQDIDSVIRCIKTCKPAFQRWKKTKVLIIDEVSMVDGRFFSQLAEIATRIRKKTDKPFGGMQLVVTGDFFQLPPVTKNNAEPIFAFESTAWQETLECTINLTQVFRQKDSNFVSALNALRIGEPTPESIQLFTSLSRPLASSSMLPTELFPLRALVAKSNAGRLAALPGSQYTYISKDTGTKLSLLDNLLAEQKVELKVGAQVMLIKNVDDVLVNGVVGKVLGFYFPNELVCGVSTGKPLSANGKSTVVDKKPLSASGLNSSLKHKSSTTSLKSATETKKNGALLRFVQLSEDGTTPVLVSSSSPPADNGNGAKENANVGTDDLKSSTGSGASLKSKPKSKTKVPENEEKCPLVLFEYPLQRGGSGSEAVLIKRDEFRVEDAEGKVLAKRIQLPLILAWAMSIHKSQGQTLHRVKVDLGKVFERGQSYVALSRASSTEGLQVVGFNPKKVMAHPKVIEWNKTLEQGTGGTEASVES